MKHLSTTLLLGLAVATVGCNTKRTRTITAADQTPTTMPSQPLRHQIAALGGGRIEALSADRWLDLGDGATRISGLRAPDRGAIAALGTPGDPQAIVWLRAGTSIEVSEDARGAVFFAIDSGRARVRVIDPALTVYARSGQRFERVSDALLEKAADRSIVAMTASRPHHAAWTLAIETPPESAGFGRLETTSTADTGAMLELRRVKVDVTTHAGYAMTEIEHVFYNEADQIIEGTFRFPVPDGAMIQGMAMEIDGRMMEAEIVEKDKARRVYQEIVDNMLDPALLEWEEGNWFKLRIFPIEARSEKRLVLRYATPLAPAMDGWEYVYNVAAPVDKEKVGQLDLVFNGQAFHTMKDLSAGKEIVIPISSSDVPKVSTETRPDGVYTAVRVRPDWDRLGDSSPAAGPRKLLVLLDTSRSSLEARPLALETLQAVLGNLEDADLFMVAATDLTTRAHVASFEPATSKAVARATAFIDAIEADGASNLQAAIELASSVGATDVVYIGDGTPTWGETDKDALIDLAGTRLASTPIYAAILGKGANVDMWQELTGRIGGKAMRPRAALQVAQFAFFVKHAPTVARIESARLAVADGTVMFPTFETTLFDGDEIVAVMRTPPDQKVPAEVQLTGRVGDRTVSQTVSLASATPVKLVSQRWAAAQMASLQTAGADKEQIVALSKDFGILSRHTSLLVLESEEMFEQFEIERRRGPQNLLAQNDQDPTVTGGDLDSLGGRDASLSPDTIQPGDPEITVPAPADARSVVVVFPFGDTKIAQYDEETQAWIVRFLIDKDTPDGKYIVTVKVTHADGQIQTLRLPYFVDTNPPDMDLTVTRTETGYLIKAVQNKAAGDVVHRDASRVELWLPSGEALGLSQVAWGRFEREWVPEQPLSGPITLDVLVTDRALNQASATITIDPEAL